MQRRCSGLSAVARVGAVIGFCGLLLVAGCGKSDPRPRFTVQGKVTLDGQPLTGGGVQFFHILQADENLPPNASLTFPTESWHAYQVQYKNALTDLSWSNLGAPIGGIDLLQTVQDPSGVTNRFYRVGCQ